MQAAHNLGWQDANWKDFGGKDEAGKLGGYNFFHVMNMSACGSLVLSSGTIAAAEVDARTVL